MIEKLRELSGEELETMAGEILRGLSFAGVKPGKELRQENEALLRGMLRLMESTARGTRTGETEQETVTSAGRAPEAETPREQSPLQTETVLYRNSFTPVIRQPDAEALSELFRRDSRRYDGGFERF